ncbi:Os06g0676801, partial [Oryza sativa Japonica Group]
LIGHNDLEIELLPDDQRQPADVRHAQRSLLRVPAAAAVDRRARVHLDAVGINGEPLGRHRRSKPHEHHLGDDHRPARRVRVVHHVRPHSDDAAAALGRAAEFDLAPPAPRPDHLRRLAVVQEEIPGGRAVLGEGDQEVDHALAHARRRQRGLLQRQDVPAGDVHVHRVRRRGQRHALAGLRGDGEGEVVEAEPPSRREVGGDGGRARLEHR